MKEQIKNFRIEIDKLSQLVKELKSSFNGTMCQETCCKDIHVSKQTEKTYDSLIFAKAWLGKILEELGQASPYPKDGDRHSVNDIEKTADTAKNLTVDVDGGWQELNYIERIDYLRQRIGVFVNIVKEDFHQGSQMPKTREAAIARTNVYNYLCEARFWLGFELQRIKKSENG